MQYQLLALVSLLCIAQTPLIVFCLACVVCRYQSPEIPLLNVYQLVEQDICPLIVLVVDVEEEAVGHPVGKLMVDFP